jgi:hypothetical protein
MWWTVDVGIVEINWLNFTLFRQQQQKFKKFETSQELRGLVGWFLYLHVIEVGCTVQLSARLCSVCRLRDSCGPREIKQWIKRDRLNYHATRLLARVLKEGIQFWYNDTSTVKRGEGGFEKTFLWKTFEVYITSCQYLFQARSKFFKHTWLRVCAASFFT